MNDILRVPRQTEVSRYLVLTGSFFMSAGMHVFIAPNIPLQCSIWPQLRYYLSIAAAIVLEDILIMTYNQTKKQLGLSKGRKDIQPTGKTEASTGAAPTLAVDDQQSTDRNSAASITADQATGIDTSPQQNGNALKDRRPILTEPNVESSAPVIPIAAETESLETRFFKVLGYVWVFAFEVWSTSKFLYLTQQCGLKLNP